MVDPEAISGDWKEIHDRLRERWCQLTHRDGQAFDEQMGYLLDLIQRTTGNARQVVERVLDELAAKAASTLESSSNTVASYAQQSGERIENGAQQALEAVNKTRRDVRMYVRRHPVESLAICFGAGVIAGLIMGSMTRRE